MSPANPPPTGPIAEGQPIRGFLLVRRTATATTTDALHLPGLYCGPDMVRQHLPYGSHQNDDELPRSSPPTKRTSIPAAADNAIHSFINLPSEPLSMLDLPDRTIHEMDLLFRALLPPFAALHDACCV